MTVGRPVPILACMAVLSAVCLRGLDGQSVSVAAGDILYHAADGTQRRVSSSGLDSMPTLSLDGRSIAFVRRTPGDTVNTALGWEERTELWVVNVDGSAARLVLRGRSGADPESILASFGRPAFSLDGRTLYVTSTGWVTSDALHAVDVDGRAERFVCAANGFELLTRGRYRGDLMVGQHRYGADGSYDGTWIVSPQGTVLRQVTLDGAPDEEAQIEAARAGTLTEPLAFGRH